ncbi:MULTISPECIES: Sec-independent protein translocase protein TatB [unclassified Haematobacter]|uniref:Sec-independent protein translocase protein TatB n=1 Tax=unclassified Haematobacter TaxID=2640585 RepID=UPI0025C211EF|nr:MULTISPECIES: Sec-independent protein translocase protein TatB [unclassified Haematobacter]
MFDIGWSELVLIGIVALVVVGPKDLPAMFRTLGRVTAKGRMMARDFQRAMEDAADEAGLKDIQRDLNSIRSPMQSGLDAVNRKLDDWDDRSRANRTTTSGVTTPPAANGSAPPPAAPVPPAATAPLETPSSAQGSDPAAVAAAAPRAHAPESVSEPAVAKASAESPGDGTKV